MHFRCTKMAHFVGFDDNQRHPCKNTLLPPAASAPYLAVVQKGPTNRKMGHTIYG